MFRHLKRVATSREMAGAHSEQNCTRNKTCCNVSICPRVIQFSAIKDAMVQIIY